MKKLLLVLFLIALSLSSKSFAFERATEWALSGFTSENTITHYIDWSSLKVEGDSVYFWELVDFRFYNSPNEDGRTGSYVTYHEGDCVKFRYRSFQTHWYENFMAEGEITETTTPKNDWKYPPPGSTQRSGLESVCNLTSHLRYYYSSRFIDPPND